MNELSSAIYYSALSQIGIGILLVAVGIPLILRKIPQNALYGIRFRASYKSDWLWYEINGYGGKVVLWGGVAWSLMAFTGSLQLPVGTFSG